jgi:hypothetical protein
MVACGQAEVKSTEASAPVSADTTATSAGIDTATAVK